VIANRRDWMFDTLQALGGSENGEVQKFAVILSDSTEFNRRKAIEGNLR
jgi:hypothetical protein